MALSDCEKCWDTPCTCGYGFQNYNYEYWSLPDLEEAKKKIEVAIQKKKPMKIQDVVQVTGRGTIFIVDLKANGYTEVGYIKEIPFKIGDTIIHESESYIIIGIETWKIFDSFYKSTIGLNVKKIYNMSVKRILKNQLELNDYYDGLGHPAGVPISKKRTFLQELQEASNNFVSPNLEEIKKILKDRADEGKRFVTFTESSIDSYSKKWLKEQGLTVEDSWSGTNEDGYSIVNVSW